MQLNDTEHTRGTKKKKKKSNCLVTIVSQGNSGNHWQRASFYRVSSLLKLDTHATCEVFCVIKQFVLSISLLLCVGDYYLVQDVKYNSRATVFNIISIQSQESREVYLQVIISL